MDEWTKRDHKSEKLAFEAVKVVCKKSLDSFIFNVFRDSFRMSWHGIAQTLNLSLTLKFLLDFFLISIWLANKKNLLSKKIISHGTDDDDGWRFDVLFLCLYAYAWSFDQKAWPTGWHKRKYAHIHTHKHTPLIGVILCVACVRLSLFVIFDRMMQIGNQNTHARTQIKLQQPNNGRCDYVNSLSMLSNIFMWVNRVFKKLHTCMRWWSISMMITKVWWPNDKWWKHSPRSCCWFGLDHFTRAFAHLPTRSWVYLVFHHVHRNSNDSMRSIVCVLF